MKALEKIVLFVRIISVSETILTGKKHASEICYDLNPILNNFSKQWILNNELTHDRSRGALIAQLVEHCTGNAKVVGSNPVKSLKLFSGHLDTCYLNNIFMANNYVKKLWPQADPESSEPTPIQTLTQKMVRTLFKSTTYEQTVICG